MPDEGEQGDEGIGVECVAEEELETQQITGLPSYRPTRSEYNEHCITHNPYRPWCKHCVEGRAQEFPHHRRRERNPNRVPLVAFDYAAM